MHLVLLPNEILHHILRYLDVKSLYGAALVNTTWHKMLTHANSKIWRKACSKQVNAVVLENPQLKLSVEQWKELATFLYKKQAKNKPKQQSEMIMDDDGDENWQDVENDEDDEQTEEQMQVEEEEQQIEDELHSPFLINSLHNTVIHAALEASSEDQSNQSIQETRKGRDEFSSFWSSKGSDSKDSNEWATFSIVNPLKQNKALVATIVDQVMIKAFRAGWQNKNIYSPQAFSLSFGNNAKEYALHNTATFAVKQSENAQYFDIGPVLLIGSIKQQEDDAAKLNGDLPQNITLTQNDIMEAWQSLGENATQDRLMGYLMQYVRKRAATAAIEAKKQRAPTAFYVRANLLGKVQTQPGDNLFYTVLELFDVKGTQVCI